MKCGVFLSFLMFGNVGNFLFFFAFGEEGLVFVFDEHIQIFTLLLKISGNKNKILGAVRIFIVVFLSFLS